MEDEHIIALYWDRDQSAIAATAEKYGVFLHRLSSNILRSHDDAEECVNDTYLRAWNAIPPTRPASFQTWLGRIVRNLSLDRWKLSQAAKRGGDNMELLLGELESCIPAPRSTEQQMEDQAVAESISCFLRTLPREQRLMFLGRYWYGESIEEIARCLRCGQGKVKSSLFRTRKALQSYLEQEGIAI